MQRTLKKRVKEYLKLLRVNLRKLVINIGHVPHPLIENE